ncbi:glycosyltransferase family 4 protein [Halorubrum ezzemoulense]|uniref:glycosyltransferase family 4 protein n=1 Tax=Halorubrum ezzemoulense TaxID=337243 RepID=UPI00232ABB4C|nr:glycosyltransferase family 4 protein [Halorubrum ezzemoulense]MDB2265487.1 glycosyltransferase family 4 protein [Halorubrum ezzemoulense]MDB9302690.1 glycosyltransferase family 4 protein [Halorubrum ezzemoulense]
MDLAFQATIDFGGLGRYSIGIIRELAKYCDTITVYPSAVSVENPTKHIWWRNMPNNIVLKEKTNIHRTLVRDSIGFKKHDLVHVNYASLGLPAIFGLKRTSTPFVYTVHHFDRPQNITNKRVLRLKYQFDLGPAFDLMARYGRIVTISDYNSEYISRIKNIQPDVVHHGINPKDYETNDVDIYEKYQIDQSDDILLFVGKFHKYKDVTTLIRAMDIITNKKDNVKLVLLSGGGNEEKSIQQEIYSRDLSENVRIIKEITDDILVSFYKKSECFVMPSKHECFGLVFLEAMLFGCPIIHTDGGAANEVVGSAGSTAAVGDETALAKETIKVLENNEIQNLMKKKGQERVKEFNWEKSARKYMSIYQEELRKNV